MNNESITGNLVIECNVQCPKCEKDIELFHEDHDGVLYNQIFRNSLGGKIDYEAYCEDCEEFFNINNVEV